MVGLEKMDILGVRRERHCCDTRVNQESWRVCLLILYVALIGWGHTCLSLQTNDCTRLRIYSVYLPCPRRPSQMVGYDFS